MDSENKSADIENIFIKGWVPYLWICAIGFVLYSQILFFDFTYFDDKILILDNFYFLNNSSNFFESFKQDVFRSHVGSYYRPILTISFMADAQVSGLNPWMYHFSNIIFHLIASCLLFTFLTKLKYSKYLSLLFSLIFTVHPVLTQAVCWIPGRNDPLVAIFILASFIALINMVETNHWKYYVYHFIFFGLAIFTKELGFITVGMILFYLVFIIKKRFDSASLKMLGIMVVGWFVMVVIWGMSRQMAFSNPMKLGISDSFNAIWRDLPAIFIFLGKILFPLKLSVLPILQDSTYIFGFSTIAILVVAFVFTQKPRFNFILFGAAWFILFLIPSFLTSKISVVSFFVEHRIYLPLIGFIVVVLETGIIRKLELKKDLLLKAGGVLILVLSVLTFMHSLNFRSRSDFWKSAVETSPHSPLARRNLGAMYYIDGTQMLDVADHEYRMELQNNPKAQRNLNSRYYIEGTRLIGMAEIEFRKSLELNAPEIMAHNNIGLIYMRKNMYKEAEEEFKKELEVNPFYDKGLFNLGLCYKEMRNIKKMEAQLLEKQGKPDEAKARLKEADELLFNAEKYWSKSFQINPDNVEAYKTLVMYYIDEKDGAKAAHFVNELQKRGVDIPPEVFRMLQQFK